MMTFLAQFLQNKSGATAIEYGLIAALVSVAIITAVTTLGTDLNSTFGSISSALTGGSSTSTSG